MIKTNTIIYNSFKNDKIILAKKNFVIKNEDDLVVTDSKIFNCQNLVITDKKEYIQFDLFYNINTPIEKIKQIKKDFIDEKLEKKYQEYQNSYLLSS